MIPRLKEVYEKSKGDLQKELSVSNVMNLPQLSKIVVNIGQGEAVQNVKVLESAMADLEVICGQKAVLTRAKRSIAGFKLRAGMPIGCQVTLRRAHMYEFLDRLVNVAIPRIRDFRGFSQKAFDGRGNYSLGIKEQIVFPEVNYDRVDKIRGIGITIVTTTDNDAWAKALLQKFRFPFRAK